MRRTLIAGLSIAALTACSSLGMERPNGPIAKALFGDLEPMTPDRALEDYYDTISDDELPRAPSGVPLPAENVSLTRILIGSCNDEEAESPVLAQIAKEDADLFLMIGDNVYGDRDGRAYMNNDPDLTELRAAFTELGESDEFQAVRARHPMMVAWDDHDYGANDSGRDFPFRRFAERVHEAFWGLDGEDVGNWDGTYYARTFGPDGQRVQIIMLDTRFFRSPLQRTDAWGEPGKERYVPAESDHQDMLGSQQWTWLSNQLRKPADLRLIVSSIQVLPTVHGYEAWSQLPAERQRLFDLINESEAKGVVFVSGDRHSSYLYKDDAVLEQPAYEITSSSLNLSFADETSELDTRQLGAGFAPVNYGEIAIDWDAGRVSLALKDQTGETVRNTEIAMAELTD
ncbi:MAG: alkaline phosphatase D family protein [Pseudomonadota bacterium]